jgi:hypothetical protein
VRIPSAPPLDERRTQEFVSELLERASAWIPSWSANSDEPDFGRALIEIAGRFSSEVAERLDRVGEKMRAGFLDWLAVRGDAARPARMPVVFKLADSATAPVVAEAPVRMQAPTADAPVVFETETTVCLVPGGIGAIVAVDADADEYYLPPPGLSDLNPLQPLPIQWRLKSFSPQKSNKLQLDPDSGLTPGMVIELAAAQYQITQVQGDIVTIDPPLLQDVESELVNKVSSFLPFDGAAHNWQEHVLYLGDMDLFNIEAPASIEISQAKNLVTGFRWEYSGKVDGTDADWQPLTIAPDAEQTVPGLLLKKAKGSIEPKIVAGTNSRWIRAVITTATGSTPRLSANQLTVKVNCAAVPGCPATAAVQSPPSDAMANTTPLVLSGPFYPLGRVPRQFDAFYLGNAEAFSKKGAKASICFEMSDPTFNVLSPVPNSNWGNTLAGVGADRALHLLQFDSTQRSLVKFRDREQLQPPSPKFNASPEPSNPIALDSNPPWRLPIWLDPPASATPDFLVGTTAGLDIWLWRETQVQTQSGWVSFGTLPVPSPPQGTTVDGWVFLGGAAPPSLVALCNGTLFVSPWGGVPQWNEVDPTDAGVAVVLKAIVPIYEETAAGDLSTWAVSGLLAVAANNTMYQVNIATGVCTALPPIGVSFDVRPVAVQSAGGGPPLIIAFARSLPDTIAMYHSVFGESSVALAANESLRGFDVSLDTSGALNFLASVHEQGADYLASWLPQTALGGQIQVFRSTVPPGLSEIGGVPTAIPGYVIIPGSHGDELVADIDFANRFSINANVYAAVVASNSTPSFQASDTVALDAGVSRQITESGTTKDNEVLYPIDHAFAAGSSGTIYGFHSSGPPLTGNVTAATSSLSLDPADTQTVQDSLLLIGTLVYRVTNVAAGIATLNPAPAADIAGAHYWNPVPINGRLAPFLRLDATNNNWDSALLDHATIVFPVPASPAIQKAKAFSVASGNRPILVVLNNDWSVAPPATPPPITLVIDGAVGSWSHLVGDTSSNPALSWEYWNGKGWWNLDNVVDGTQNLKSTGALQFNVPNDIASSDWGGKTNFWIRARLVGGDYGQEEVKVITTTNSSGQTVQTVERSSDNIKAPLILDFQVSYSICDPVLPTYVLSKDSGSTRDQSDANRTGGAVVEAFVPLGLTLGRLSGPASQTNPPVACPPECTCQSGSAIIAATPNPTASPIAFAPATGRAILIGLTSPPSGAPVNILLLVDTERPFDAFAPMKIEALVGDRFIPIVTKDSTRALGESGVLSLSFELAPTLRELFGQNLCWIRLTPVNNNAVGTWMPTLRGVYLNAVWASATETLTRELVGSSQGAPNLTLTLARPPLLADSLELRVKEPLGEEERTALQEQDSQLVKNIPELPGDWVLWKSVTDPGDEAPTARVYALDESIGEIRFGDGQHGMIPPIGTDSIVAFSYQRTEPGTPGSNDVPANTITARTQLNLVSPVPTVEAAFAADDAAGGAAPESVDRVVRFGTAKLRHRERVVSAQDLEDIALESSPKIVQASCLQRTGYLRLIIVMKGANPQPSAAEVRELSRLLLAAAPPGLSTSNVLRIKGPTVRKLRIELTLRIEDLDYAGDVSNSAVKSLTALFDTATGGVTKDGWALGDSPTDIDIAIALTDTPRLEAIENVTLVEVGDQDSESPWPQSLGPNELVMPAADPVRIQFTVPEAVA